jgi:hypothetical protein
MKSFLAWASKLATIKQYLWHLLCCNGEGAHSLYEGNHIGHLPPKFCIVHSLSLPCDTCCSRMSVEPLVLQQGRRSVAVVLRLLRQVRQLLRLLHLVLQLLRQVQEAVDQVQLVQLQRMLHQVRELGWVRVLELVVQELGRGLVQVLHQAEHHLLVVAGPFRFSNIETGPGGPSLTSSEKQHVP